MAVKRIIRYLWWPAAILAAVVLLSAAVDRLDAAQGEEGRRCLEQSIRRAAVSCYAEQGVYPDSRETIEADWGVQIDNDRYNVFYEVFADNIMPEITVLLR